MRLVRGELTAEGQIAWKGHGHAGLRFTQEIDVEAWVRRAGHPGQQRVDEAVAALRHKAGTVPSRPSDGPTLAEISGELSAICERLASLPSMTVELGEELVRLDALARMLEQFAAPR